MKKPKIELIEIKIKRAYEPADESDGARILVDRLWPRGLSKTRAALSMWLKEIAPSSELRTWFGHDPKKFEEFRRRYRLELAANGDAVKSVVNLLKRGPATLVYAAHDEVHNHAVVLSEYIREVMRKDESRKSRPTN
ncbi:MAG: DUF488 domain-containing protein [Proteobacteria bacterium]|nr:DUF488 domain-containing protein [Pseudomonadota bacterium]